ncbi:DUF5994 family protein [Streptomyces physcomitrii]|uniref:Uncharacterized protein n=1 Tax=Streptomyces physcomitrii TaxID=2724184 RepID=A0ABX1GXV3_9ACTN|nr:DUF5994 family protein [Streptomyces physcomitrii]NKI40918.1 hypothetical protein [Streptomyces physcomitrii]
MNITLRRTKTKPGKARASRNELPSARLSLVPEGMDEADRGDRAEEGGPTGERGPVGAWWPRSRDLTRELPALAAALAERCGEIGGARVNPAHWPLIPHKVHVEGYTVQVGWFTDRRDPHKIVLDSETQGTFELLVVPPETGEALAERLLSAAAVPGGLGTANRLLTASETEQGIKW